MSMDLAQLMAAMEATAAAAEKPIAVDVPGWGTIHVRGLTTAQMDQQLGEQAGGTKKHQFARGIARLMCDEAGKRLWEGDLDDKFVELLSRQPWSMLQRLAKATEPDPPKG